MKELIEYAEKAGLENLRFRLQNAETLAKEANTTLALLLAGIGVTTAYVIKGLEQPNTSFLTFGIAGLVIWLMITAILLVYFCILSTELPVPTNEPMNLYQPDFELDAIRAVELKNIDARIKEATAHNHRIAAWLDRIRLLAITSPFVFTLASLLAWVVC
jgi:hypothetical protein